MRGIARLRMRSLIVAIAWSLLALPGGAPTAAAGPDVATFAAGAYHACAVRTGGTVWCWGRADLGQLGDGSTGDAIDHLRTMPVQVRRGSSMLRGVTKIAAGAEFTCAVRTDGTVWCWGSARVGQLGNDQAGPGEYRTTAVRVRRVGGSLTGVRHITAGDHHACALRTNGSVYCWGYARYGQLGDGTTGVGMGDARSLAVRVRRGGGYLDDVVALAGGYYHTCAVRSDGSVWCWGAGSYGQLGDGESGIGHQRTKPGRVLRGSGHLTRVAGIAAGAFHTCARRTDGTAWCWGSDEFGQLGDGTTGDPAEHIRSKPVQVRRGSGFLTRVAGIGAGGSHTCALRSDRSAWCWGPDEVGQLGDGTTGDPTTHVRLKPVQVVRRTGDLTRVRKLDGGAYFMCALRTDRTVWCWGSNESGQSGRGSHDADPHPHPRRVLFP